MSVRHAFLLVAALPLFSSCETSSGSAGNSGSGYLAGLGVSQTQPTTSPHANTGAFWDGNSAQGSPMIHINTNEQRAYFYKGGELVGMTPISSGSFDHTTPPGKYKVTQMDEDHESSLYGQIVDATTGEVLNNDADTRKHRADAGEKFVHAPMPYFLRFNGGIGMHAGHLPGYAASHGCVRMPKEMAQIFFESAEMGMPVIVR